MATPENAIMIREAGKGTVGVPASTTDTTDYVKQAVVGDKGGSFEENIVPVLSPRAALAISAVYRAIELRAKTVGQMQMQYQRLDREGGNFIVDVASRSGAYLTMGTKLNYLLQVEPNPIMSAASLWEQVTIDRLQKGNGFIYIERDMDGEPVALWLAECGGYNYVAGTYTITFLSDRGILAKANVPRRDVLHFPNTFRDQNGFWGIPTLRYAFDTLTLIRTQKRQALENAAKGGRVKLLIGEEKPAQGVGTMAYGLFNKEESNKYAKEINDKIYEQDVVSLRGLEKVQNISMTSQDMQMVEQLGLGYDDVCRYYAVPRPLLMLDTNSHYNDYQNATMEFHTRTILPLKNRNEKEISRKLIGMKDYGTRDIHICEDPLMVMDPERRAKVAQLKMQAGLCTVNEARRDFDMPAVEDGDVPMASANLMTLKALIAKSDASTTLKPGNYTVEEPPKEGEDGAQK